MKSYTYTFTIMAMVILAFFIPEPFIKIGDFKLTTLIKPFLQIIMLGMGATMTAADFVEVFKSPKKVVIGLVCQFTIMPLLGFALSKSFNFEPEIAAGIILIGCSPSGLASNVMSLLAKANVALSITITTMATLLAPVLTPLLMKILGGNLIQINFWDMFIDMSLLVIVPVLVGLALNSFVPNFIKKITQFLPIISMIAVAYIVLVVTANGQASLAKVGLVLILVNLVHNLGGYTLGYVSAKLLGLSEPDARAVSLEVGMQNGGLASALANEMGKIGTVGLASAIFGPMMNISGSILANYWSKKK
jgi:bile acid:Na+ symporter, BASS family